MPENYMFGRRPLLPLWNRNINTVIGEPIEFDLPKLKQTALYRSKDSSHSGARWPILKPCGLDEAAQRWLYTSISERIRTVMERLQSLGKLKCWSKVQRTELDSVVLSHGALNFLFLNLVHFWQAFYTPSCLSKINVLGLGWIFLPIDDWCRLTL